MKLTYIYHSCFALEFDAFTVIVDYYKDTVMPFEKGLIHSQLLNRPGKIYILSSHSHPDHFNPEILLWKQQRDDIQYIFSHDILDAGLATKEDAIYLNKLDIYEDNHLKVKAYGSTDIGISFLIQAEGKQIFHAGDLNNWHWNEECPIEESQGYETNYLNELKLIVNDVNHLDLAIFPVDPRLGKEYMRGAEQFINQIQTDIFSPMHFDEAYIKAAAFTLYAETKRCESIKWAHRGEHITI